jgi:ABC-type Fe3+ transport system permease subunit/DNA-binding beta-propeller fold protein YncE
VITAAGLWLIVGLCCLAPLLWMIAQLLLHPAVIQQLRPTSFQLRLLGRTLLYNGTAAVIACLLAIAPALVIGRARGWFAKVLLLLLPAALVMPSVCYTYGWLQFFRLLGISFYPAGLADVLRCIWTLACWLWPVPAAAVGLSLRHIDPDIQQQALLDGAYWRTTARMLLGPMLAGGAIVLVLAMQEFSVYERSGISVIATEVRTVFETGLSMQSNPAAISGVSTGSGLGDAAQAGRAAAALASAIPMLAIVAALIAAVLFGGLRSIASERVSVGPYPRILSAGWPWAALAGFVVIVSLLVPTVAMVLSISPHRWLTDAAGHSFPVKVWDWAEPYVNGTMLYASLAAAAASLLAILSAVRRSRWMLIAALAAFLIGGELLAIAHIRIFNPTLHGSVLMILMAYVGRFGWLALLAGFFTWTRPYRELRDMAAVDGAGPWRTALHAILPIAWPILLAGVAAVCVLSMTEVSATVLLAPARPPTLIVTLMSWVHLQRFDEMLEGSLLLMAIAFVLAVACVLLIALGRRFASRLNRPMRSMLLFLALAAILSGCDDRSKPQVVWGETGSGPGQFIYPRPIAYSPRDDCFFIVDRTAHVQRFDSRGQFVLDWHMPEWQAGKPVGMKIGPDGNLYIADTHYARVMVYTPDGKLLRQWGSLGKGPGQFIFVTDVAFDAAGNIYVSEYGDNDRIQVFDPTAGRVLRVIGSFGQRDGQFSRPQSMVIDGNLLYVTDSSNHRIAVFKTDGTFVRNIGSIGSNLGQFRFPYGLTMDAKGRLVVTEFGNNRVQLIDKETGRGLRAWGAPGREEGQLAYPWSAAVDRNGRVVVVDSGNNRLQVFSW